jgi:hypothetical protein
MTDCQGIETQRAHNIPEETQSNYWPLKQSSACMPQPRCQEKTRGNQPSKKGLIVDKGAHNTSEECKHKRSSNLC